MSAPARPVRFAGVTKRFDTVRALFPIDLDVAAGEFVTLLGPSGSGKTTLLNIAAGYIAPSAGQVLIGGRDVTWLPARRRNIGMVFQNYALFPHMSVAENVAYGLKVRGFPRDDIARKVGAALGMVRLEGMADRAIRQLSGGQQQRVALARALVIEPDVLLMDEPLGALDRQLRKHVQLEIRRLHLQLGRTTIYVTHDQEEALVMSDRIGVMSEGRLEQVDSARALYERPANSFVASFLGESNLLDGVVTDLADGRAGFAIDGLAEEIEGIAAAGLALRRRAVALVRPEDVRILPCNAPGFAARVEELVYLGELIAVRVRLGNGKELWSRRFAREGLPSETIHVGWDPDHVRILPRSDNPATKEDQG